MGGHCSPLLVGGQDARRSAPCTRANTAPLLPTADQTRHHSKPNPTASIILPLNPAIVSGDPVRHLEDPDPVLPAQPQSQARLREPHPPSRARTSARPRWGTCRSRDAVRRPLDADTPVDQPPALDPLHFTNQFLNAHLLPPPPLGPVLRFRPPHTDKTNLIAVRVSSNFLTDRWRPGKAGPPPQPITP